MAIRDWHPGQLAVLWAGGAGLEYVVSTIISIHGPQGLSFTLVEGRAVHYPSSGAEIAYGILNLILVALPTVLLVVTWKWFGSRNPPKNV